jgi:two-component system osmolarity sensor histidine kinase EnvZ
MAGLSEAETRGGGGSGPGTDPAPVPLIKRYLPRSLFGRALLIIVTPMVLVQAFATFMFYDRHWDQVTRRLALGLAGDVSMAITMYESFPGADERRRLMGALTRDLHLIASVLDGEPLPTGGSRLGIGIRDGELVDAFNERLGRPYYLDTQSLDEWIEIRVPVTEGSLRIFADKSRVQSSSTYIFIMWMVGSALVLLTIAVLFMRNQLRSIRRLARAADEFGKGRDVPDFKPSGATEVRRAATAFLRMRERIERQIRQRTEMLAGVSHDLRTPLTRMKLELALLAKQHPDLSKSLTADLNEMQQMVEAYLAFARGEGEEAAMLIDFGALVTEAADEARRHGADVALELDGDLELNARPRAVKRAITNLVDNARRYGSHVRLRAYRGNGAVELVVDDDGPGIPPEHYEEVFKPFSRLDGSRNPETGGTGLGLSIALDIARGHGGDITLDRSPLGGLRARLRLPV